MIPMATPSVRVACHVRKSSLVAPVDSTLRTLDSLEVDGDIDSYTVGAWPAEVHVGEGDTPSTHSDVVALFEEFDAWAEQCGASIRPPFAVETRTSEITGESRDVLTTPVQCLAVYVDDALAEVLPHSAGRAGDGETCTVADGLAFLQENDVEALVGAGRFSDARSLARDATPKP